MNKDSVLLRSCLQEEPDEHGQGKWEGKQEGKSENILSFIDSDIF
jgi:hypothetical protein